MFPKAINNNHDFSYYQNNHDYDFCYNRAALGELGMSCGGPCLQVLQLLSLEGRNFACIIAINIESGYHI